MWKVNEYLCLKQTHGRISKFSYNNIFSNLFLFAFDNDDMSLPKSHVVDSAREADLHENKGIAM